MPVTARLSKLFYDRMGEQVANELVEWFNQVDATYRADLRELNELNFARFDAKLEQRIAQVEAKIDRRIAELRAELIERIVRSEARLETLIERRISGLTRWMFAMWLTTMLAFLGLFLRG